MFFFSFLFRQFSWRIFAIICFRFVVVFLLLCTRVGNFKFANMNTNTSVNTRTNMSSNTSFECWVSVRYSRWLFGFSCSPWEHSTKTACSACSESGSARLGSKTKLTGDTDWRQTTDDWEMQRRSVERGAWKRQQRQPNSTIQLVADTKSNWLHGREAQTELNWTEQCRDDEQRRTQAPLKAKRAREREWTRETQ